MKNHETHRNYYNDGTRPRGLSAATAADSDREGSSR